ncbi:hypothetical protein [Flexivirga alba]|uniref:Uncharacterized protein n=1 Tax=Flexivirga alba TaxID=702742 RepID=A0ABW2AJL9_9MICO
MPGADCDVVRVVDHDVRPGVESDMGDGDGWPPIRDQVMGSDILVQRVLERLDAELSDTDGQDPMPR